MNGRRRLHTDGLIVTVALLVALGFTLGVLVGRAAW